MSALPRDPTAALLVRLNRNINALGSAVDEIRIWISRQGDVGTALSIGAYLDVLQENADEIAEGMVDLIVRIAQAAPVEPHKQTL
ncbi:MAG TPA: hypothetical protein VF671_13425 [Pseudomonas sp.]|jgi:hypothetical protein|uniref:hypothetical protein n=1 Tax=Pseudomonas sp. TaxID=306 RepID=UPI002EDA6B47